MVVVGAYARIELSEESRVPQRLEALEGVSTFPLGDAGKIGILVEAESLDEAHARLSKEIRELEGVRGVFPVYVNAEDVSGENPDEGAGS
jgi:nitrate reductase NapAB chaperone NapD